ncbi:MAG: aminotransferase class V-fold PLP-dependent enzyme [Acidobacteria bacterium]|nr:aminotransferase class V-fold PLP-dependent enzyme [Acidobacteriota bacterium]
MSLSRRSLLTAAAVRPLVALDRSLIYMNAANIAPCGKAALAEYLKQLQDFQQNPAFQNREVYKPLSESVRARLAKLLGAAPPEIALTRNASEGNNLIAQGLRLRPGDEILITAHNHPSNTQSWQLRARQAGAAVVTAEVPIYAKTAEELLGTIARKVTARTRVIALSHLTNTTGLLYPIAAIAELAHQKNAWCHVDGAQSFGWMNLNLPALRIDSFTGSFHKWPMGPLESGLLYVREGRLEELTPAILSVDYWSDKPTGARKFETLGQRDDPKLRGLEKTIEFLETTGMAAIERRALAIAERLRQGLAGVPGAKLKGSGEAAVSGPVVKVDFPGQDLMAIYNRLWTKHRIAIAKTDAGDAAGLRFSPHIYNTEAEVDRVVRAVRL